MQSGGVSMEERPNQEEQELLNSVEQWKIDLAETQKKTNQTMAIVTGTALSLSAITAISNLTNGNSLFALQNTGAVFALTTMLIGFIKLINLKKEEIEEIKNKAVRNTNMISSEQEILKKLKRELKEYQIRSKMTKGEGLGFAVASIAGILCCLTSETITLLLSGGLSTLLSGAVVGLCIGATKNNNQRMTDIETRIKELEEPEEQTTLEESDKKLLK